jgi:hypothetical protein
VAGARFGTEPREGGIARVQDDPLFLPRGGGIHRVRLGAAVEVVKAPPPVNRAE